MRKYLFFLCLLKALSLPAHTIDLSTTIWNNCKNGSDSLEALFQFHRPYINKDVTIKYPANQVIHLDITEKAQTIWLSNRTDFNGCTFIVNNQRKNHFLFAIAYPDATARPINIGKETIDEGNFSRFSELKSGLQILFIEDRKPWIENRKGYNYGAVRKDILFIKNGKVLNQITTNYNTANSNPECKYLDANNTEKLFTNITFVRTANSTAITNLLAVSLQNNVMIDNISIYTPAYSDKQPQEGDQCFRIYNSTNVTFRDVSLNGTYSGYNKYGYGINMDNVWNSAFIRLKTKAQWGIFGNNNINNITLEDCDINRFDIHCYGRDITFRNCTFRNNLNDINTYNQFSSVFGTILFENCRFLHFYPVLHESSYNAYTGYNLVMRNCYMELDRDHDCIIRAGKLENVTNSRPELKEKCWPNIDINGLTLKTNGVTDFYLFKPTGENKYSQKLEHLSYISINNMQLIPSEATLQFHESPYTIRTKQRMKRTYSLPNNIRLKKRIK